MSKQIKHKFKSSNRNHFVIESFKGAVKKLFTRTHKSKIDKFKEKLFEKELKEYKDLGV